MNWDHIQIVTVLLIVAGGIFALLVLVNIFFSWVWHSKHVKRYHIVLPNGDHSMRGYRTKRALIERATEVHQKTWNELQKQGYSITAKYYEKKHITVKNTEVKYEAWNNDGETKIYLPKN